MSYILIVDDEKEITSVLKEYLEMFGHRIVVAGDGMEAYLKAANQKFDVIVSDYHMPKATGAELVKKLRENSFNKKTPVIIYTAYIDPAKTELTGFDSIKYLSKPTGVEEIQSAIENLLRS